MNDIHHMIEGIHHSINYNISIHYIIYTHMSNDHKHSQRNSLIYISYTYFRNCKIHNLVNNLHNLGLLNCKICSLDKSNNAEFDQFVHYKEHSLQIYYLLDEVDNNCLTQRDQIM